MRRIEEEACVVRLACETADRTKAEQAALLAVARRVDREWNAQTSSNVLLRGRTVSTSTAPPCSFPFDGPHDKSVRVKCPGCGGDGVALVPEGGWSRLSELVANTLEEGNG